MTKSKKQSSTRKLFGTDGIRGRANQEPMTVTTVLNVAMAAASQFRRGNHRHRVVIGKDTRLSGYMLEPALTAGFIAKGMDVILLGPLPTPAVAMLTKSLRADIGVMISASHNPYEDNGIKIFGPDGFKLSDAFEEKIEKLVSKGNVDDLAPSPHLGKASRLDDAIGRYVEYVKATFPAGLRLDGMKIVVDCANGAAYRVAPEILWELGAEVVAVAVQPDGKNINHKCGATYPQLVQEAVLMHQADVGIALDGDADRVIMVDEKGRKIDGDFLMALIAQYWKKNGKLKGKAVVSTVMSNLGMEKFLAANDIKLARTAVGDRYVMEEMRKSGCNVGGEQSGHIILSDYCSTGDALIAALQVLAVIRESGKSVSKACDLFKLVPQLLVNVKAPGEVLNNSVVKKAIKEAEARLAKDKGRLLIRKSGTEPLVRIMTEGTNAKLIKCVADELAAVIKKAAK